MKLISLKMNNQDGFTLVEVLVALVVAMVVSAAAYAAYKVQQRTSTVQQQVTEIQQNVRAAIEIMSRDFRMAGYDPTAEGRYTIDVATVNSFQFTADLCENGGDPKAYGVTCGTGPFPAQNLDEQYFFQLSGNTLLRTTGAPQSAIAENIERVELLYILENGTTSLAPIGPQRDNIRAVRVSILGRAGQPDYKYTNTTSYITGSGVTLPLFNDNFRRRMLIKTIYCRNMGLI